MLDSCRHRCSQLRVRAWPERAAFCAFPLVHVSEAAVSPRSTARLRHCSLKRDLCARAQPTRQLCVVTRSFRFDLDTGARVRRCLLRGRGLVPAAGRAGGRSGRRFSPWRQASCSHRELSGQSGIVVLARAWKGENLVPGSAGAQGVCGSESTWKGREGGEQVPARRCLRSGSPCHLCPNRDTSQSKSAVTTTLDSR